MMGGLPWIFDFALVTLKEANFALNPYTTATNNIGQKYNGNIRPCAAIPSRKKIELTAGDSW